MNGLAYHIASGGAFFSGAILLLAALGLAACRRSRLKARLQLLCFLSGAGLIALSSASFPWWAYLVWGLAVTIVCGWDHPRSAGYRVIWIATCILTLTVIAWELRWQRRPMVPPLSARTLLVIGDSISTGLGDKNTVCWPALLHREHGVPLTDLSAGGATLQSALAHAIQANFTNALVLLEIGGNDLLGHTSVDDFDRDLEKLVCLARERGACSVVMLELPLPPFKNSYGRSQRRIAADHGVHLVPKRCFAAVLRGADATTDGLHLSQIGQQRMAELVWNVIRPAFP